MTPRDPYDLPRRDGWNPTRRDLWDRDHEDAPENPKQEDR